MNRVHVLAMLTFVGVICPPTHAEPQEVKTAEPRTYNVVYWLPRFDGHEIDGKRSPSFEEVKAALKGLSCLPKNAHVYGDNNGGRMVQFAYLPKSDSDLGDVAKALSKLGGDKKKPVATLNLAQATPITEEEFATIKKELAKAKGIDWDKSGRSGLALDEAGGAKFLEIRAAYKKAGVTLVTGLDDK
jgi:hypothetical protein